MSDLLSLINENTAPQHTENSNPTFAAGDISLLKPPHKVTPKPPSKQRTDPKKIVNAANLPFRVVPENFTLDRASFETKIFSERGENRTLSSRLIAFFFNRVIFLLYLSLFIYGCILKIKKLNLPAI